MTDAASNLAAANNSCNYEVVEFGYPGGVEKKAFNAGGGSSIAATRPLIPQAKLARVLRATSLKGSSAIALGLFKLRAYEVQFVVSVDGSPASIRH
jgi:hypothetical protein